LKSNTFQWTCGGLVQDWFFEWGKQGSNMMETILQLSHMLVYGKCFRILGKVWQLMKLKLVEIVGQYSCNTCPDKCKHGLVFHIVDSKFDLFFNILNLFQ
jgi:hypothetical protein